MPPQREPIAKREAQIAIILYDHYPSYGYHIKRVFRIFHELYLPWSVAHFTLTLDANRKNVPLMALNPTFPRRWLPLRPAMLVGSTLSLLMAIYATLLLVHAIPWIERPFPGFPLLRGQKVDFQIPETWTGARAGLLPMDRILAVEGEALTSSADLYERVAAVPVGTPIRYTIARMTWDGRETRFEREIPTQRFPMENWSIIFLGTWLTGIAYLVVGFATFLLRANDRRVDAFFALCLGGSFHFLTLLDSSATYLWPSHVPSLLGLSAFGASGLNLAMRFPRPLALSTTRRRVLAFLSAVAMAAFGILTYPLPEWTVWSYSLPCAFAGLGGIAVLGNILWSAWSPSSTARERFQSRSILWGSFLALVPAFGLLYALLSGHNGLLLNAGTLFSAMLPLAIAIAMVRHGLFDIDLLLRPSLTYALISGLLVTLYFSVLTLVSALIGERSPLANLAATAVVALAFAPLRDRLKAWLDQTFFRSAYDADAVRREFTQQAQETLSSEDLNQAFMRVLEGTFHATSGAAYMTSAQPPYWRMLGAFGFTPDETTSDMPLPSDLPNAETFEIRIHEEEFLVIKLGRKRSELPYTNGDRRLVHDLGQALATRLKVYEYMGMEQRQALQIKALEESQAMQEQFLNLVSHELKTPISVILGAINTLNLHGRSASDSVRDAYLGRIQRNAEGLSLLLGDLLHAGQLQSGQFKLHRRPTSLARVIEGAIADLAPMAAHKQQDLSADVADCPDLIELDPHRIEQAIRNLVVNAIKHTGPGSAIRIRTLTTPGLLRCEVTDSGPGIAPDDLPKLFKRFSRLDDTGGSGVGLGLFIAQAIVEAHGGTIGVESQPGQGSTFFFELPHAQSGA